MTSVREQIIAELSQLVGLRWAEARRILTLFSVTFDIIGDRGSEAPEPLRLFVMCPWRIDDPTGVLVGQLDIYEPVERPSGFDSRHWDYENPACVYESRMCDFLTRHGQGAVVTSVDADECGGVVVRHASGFAFRLFPAGTQGTHWRLFRPAVGQRDFVVGDGKVTVGEI